MTGGSVINISQNIGYARDKNTDNIWFLITLLFFIIEYGRPQDKLNFIGVIRPAMLLSLLLVFSWFVKRSRVNVMGRQMVVLLIFIVLTAVYIPLAVNNHYAFQTTETLLMYLPFFFSFIIYVNSFDRLRKFFRLYIYMMFYICINVITFGSGEGMGGNFLADENDYTLYINMMIPFAFYLFLYEKNAVKKIVYASACTLGVVSIIISFSRGGFVGLLCVGFMIWLYSPRKIVTLLLIGALTVGFFQFSGEKYLTEMGTITDTEESTSKQRIETWKSGWYMFLDNPLGVGGSNFIVRFQEYQTDFFSRGMWGRAAHSVWIQLLSELGVFGVLIYGILLFYNLKDIFWLKKFKSSKDKEISFAYYLSLSFFASIIGYFASGSFISVLYYPHYYYLTAMIFVTKRLVERRVLEINVR